MKIYYLRFYEPERYKENIQEKESGGTSAERQSSGPGYSSTDLPVKEYLRFIKGWDLLVLVADVTTIWGTLGLADEVCESCIKDTLSAGT